MRIFGGKAPLGLLLRDPVQRDPRCDVVFSKRCYAPPSSWGTSLFWDSITSFPFAVLILGGPRFPAHQLPHMRCRPPCCARGAAARSESLRFRACFHILVILLRYPSRRSAVLFSKHCVFMSSWLTGLVCGDFMGGCVLMGASTT